MPKFEIVGDVHGDFKTFTSMVNAIEVDAIIQVGDFGYWPGDPSYEKHVGFLNNLNKPVYFIDGNHENHHKLIELSANTTNNIIEIMKNVYYIKRGKIVDILGCKVFGMGGAFSVDRALRTEDWDWFKEETISYKDMMNIPDPSEKIDLMITHTCPNEFVYYVMNSIYKTQNHKALLETDPSRFALSQILKMYNITDWYFGHWHIYLKEKYENVNWTCLSSLQSNERCHETFETQ